jgi:hypothetical protein
MECARAGADSGRVLRRASWARATSVANVPGGWFSRFSYESSPFKVSSHLLSNLAVDTWGCFGVLSAFLSWLFRTLGFAAFSAVYISMPSGSRLDGCPG